MIRAENNNFILDTANTTYAFRVTKSGHLEHLYYGRRIGIDTDDLDVLVEKCEFAPGNTINYTQDDLSFSLEDMCLEMSSLGKGDIREPFIEIIHADGGTTCDFLYKSHTIKKENPKLSGMPSSYSDDVKPDHLTVTLVDEYYDLCLELHYFVYEDSNVITRFSRFINKSEAPVRLRRLMSNQIDFSRSGLRFTTFTGAWVREMNKNEFLMNAGKAVNSTLAGVSSNRANPFVMISNHTTNEDKGLAYGFNLVYSGNHYEAVEVSSFNKTRFVQGINPQNFEYFVDKGEVFESPEAIMTVSKDGFNGMSQNLHKFIRNHIVRGEWKFKPRPILINSWEASYFKISEAKLMKLATRARAIGIELFVMDDGWFGKRDNDTTSLGDWKVNPEKFPKGLDHFVKSVNRIGLDFGIWVEPEMVSVDSDLYRAHPDWALEIPGHAHSEGRNQRILDLTREDVREYIISAMSDVFSSAKISYVKWDMNRIMSDVYSSKLPPERQGEVAHRYVLGLYEIMKRLTTKFPHILFEGCASGGNRFDLGILSYFPQIWASDNTDAFFRVNCMTNYSYGYPMSTLTAHVSSSPNHQTLRNMPLETRFNVAIFGVFGYELNLPDLSLATLTQQLRKQVSFYKEYRDVLQYGNFYRGRQGNLHEWTVVSPDRNTAIGMLMQEHAEPNVRSHIYLARGLDKNKVYRFEGRTQKVNLTSFGDLVNMISPIHIKNDGQLLHILSKIYKLPGEVEEYTASGDVLMYAGVKLKQAFAGTGMNDNTRIFPDFASRLYVMKSR
ncbi:MAG: alpha-galactosidase [Clostridia bacterium]|nr:alpha-galactosidase [Clostridia bacterium]